MSRVAAVVVTYNRKALLAECLRALLAQSAPIETIHVVDNASTDGTHDLLRSEGLLERLEYHRLEVNGGSSRGVAAGIAGGPAGGAPGVWGVGGDAPAPPGRPPRPPPAPPPGRPGTPGVGAAPPWAG